MPRNIWGLILATVLVLLLGAILLTQVATYSLGKLGLSPVSAILVLVGSLLGGAVNLPLWRRRVERPAAAGWRLGPEV